MTMTDPIADMLTRLRNANQAHHDSVSMPSSKLKVNIASILKSEGYIADYAVVDAEVGKTLTLSLKYGANRQRAIQGVRQVHQPAQGSRWPRGGYFVHLLWSPNRQAGREQGCRRGSPRLHLVRTEDN